MLLPSDTAIAEAIKYIRRHAPFAGLDKWPVDIAAPTSLYIGVALREEFPRAKFVDIAEMAGIELRHAIEFAALCEIAADSEWIDYRIVNAARSLVAPIVRSPIPARGAGERHVA